MPTGAGDRLLPRAQDLGPCPLLLKEVRSEEKVGGTLRRREGGEDAVTLMYKEL